LLRGPDHASRIDLVAVSAPDSPGVCLDLAAKEAFDMMGRWFALGVIGVGLAVGGATRASACPSCKEAVQSDASDDSQRLATGYSRSILLMMGMPFVLAGVGALLVVRAAREGRLPEL
jgi:hypothetical protein